MQGSPSLLTLGLLARDLHLAFAGFVCVVVGLIARACLRSLVGLRVEGRLGPRAELAGLAVSWREASCLGPVVDGPWTRWGRSPVGCPCVLWASPCAGTVVSACGDGRGLRTVHGFPALGCAISGLCRLCGHLGEFVSWGGLAVLLSWPLWGLAELVVR